jgi:ubiquinone/menaquinone biosynthesis C-methylase UbiE
MTTQARWIEQSPETIARRYDRLAPFYGALDWLYLLPLLGIRSKTVSRLRLQPGDSVLEIGCGSGTNLPLLVAGVGPSGAVLGVDLSPGMLERARALCRRRSWSNVDLTRADAAEYAPPIPPNAVLFSFSYSAIPQRSRVLASAWNILRTGGRLVITDLSLSGGRALRIVLPFANWYSRRTLLGKPDTQPWQDLADHAGAVDTQRIALGGLGHFVICSATKAVV